MRLFSLKAGMYMFENNDFDGLEYISRLSHSGRPVTDLSRIKHLLSAIGDPQDKLRFVHIAGTNGKGSMAQMFNGIFVHRGLKTGLFTSPYIFEFSDRIRVNNENIPVEALSRLALAVKEAAQALPEYADFSQFEITTAIAFLYFLEMQCDIVVLETGLGGLLDCTNAVTTSVLTAIGSVDLDHTAILGDTVELIAQQKAGILKQNVPCVLNGKNIKSVQDIFRSKAEELSCQLVISDPAQIIITEEDIFGSTFTYKGEPYITSMGGSYQTENAATVIEGAKLLCNTFSITDTDIYEGIRSAQVPARAQVLCQKPVTILDGGHNPDAMRALSGLLGKLCADDKKIHAVIGMCKDKNIRTAIGEILPYITDFITVDGFSPRAEDRRELADIIIKMGADAQPAVNDLHAEIISLQKKYPDDVILICGSLYLAGEVGRDIG